MKNKRTISFSISINSDRGKVWEVLWDPKAYQQWTSVFCQGSHYIGELKQGNIIKFLGDDGRGLSSYIEKLIDREQMVFSHQKEIQDGKETDSTWQGAREIYYLKKETDNCTELQVIMDVTQDMESYFNEVFPKALILIKELAELN
ncbi:MAG TPA: hypothetical protein VFM79_13720 [Pelobium sp.]|nr:hypothetical protein [Pelobium sp.]